jgi:hypothetical protein
LELKPGFTERSYSRSDGKFHVHFYMHDDEESIFHQTISSDESGVCIDQKVDMRE